MRSIVIPDISKSSVRQQSRISSVRYQWVSGGLLALVFPAFILLLWQVASYFEWMPEQILPSPSLTLHTAIELIHSGELGSALGISLLRLTGGFLIGSTLGLSCGLLFAMSRTADEYIGPTVRAFCLVPSLGWLPFFMLIFGIGETLKFILIAKTCFLPVLISSYNAAQNLPQKYRDVAQTLELSRRERLTIIYLPAITPAIFSGLRLSLSKGWKTLILVEMIASAAGIGYLMTWGRKAFQLDVVFVTIIFIGLTGWLIDYLASRWEKKLMRWIGEDK